MSTELTTEQLKQLSTPVSAAGPESAGEPTSPSAAENAFLAGNPLSVGLPVFIAGSVALALVLIGYVPASATAASLPVIATATGVGLTIATVWAAAVGQSAVASVFAIFAGFWLSYAALVLGLTHNWFAITPAAATHTQGLFLITWLVVIGLLTLSTLRLPLAFSLLFLLVDLALAAVLIGTINASTDWLKVGGVLVFLFAAVGAYVYAGVAAAVTGGSALPLGRPVLAG